MLCRKDCDLEWNREIDTRSVGLAHQIQWCARVLTRWKQIDIAGESMDSHTHSSIDRPLLCSDRTLRCGVFLVAAGRHSKKVTAIGLAFASIFRQYVALRAEWTRDHPSQPEDWYVSRCVLLRSAHRPHR